MFRLPLTLFLLLSILNLNAQNFLLKKLEEKVNKKLTEKGTDLRVQLDSLDFQFAISVNQGAGFFDIEQKGETSSKLLYSLKEEKDKTLVDKARDSLEIGIGMYGIRRYELAEQTIRTLKLSMESNGLTDEIVYLRVISNLGLICLTQGRTEEAKEHITKASIISENTLGKNSAAYIANLNNNAKRFQLLGEYSQAEKAFDEALTYSEKVFGGGMQQAIILNNKAMLYQALGQYDKAVNTMNEAITASGKAPKKILQGKKSFDNRKFKANLATLYQVSGRYEEAERLFKELKNIFENRKQTKNAEYAGLLNQFGILYIQMEKTNEVEDLLMASLNVYKKRWGENNIYFAKVANDLGNFHRAMAQYNDAKKWLTKAYDIRQQLLSPSHPDYIKTQEDLAMLYWKTDRQSEAYTVYKDVIKKTLDVINRFFPSMSESEKTKFWDITFPRFQRFYNFALETLDQNSGILEDVYNYNMATKGLLLNATSKVKAAILNSNDDELISDYLIWQDKKEQLSRLYSYSKGKLRAQQIDLPKLENEANILERQLSERSSKFSSTVSSKKNDYKTLIQLLEDNEAIVDIIRINGFDQNFNDNVRYLVMVLKKESSSPDFVLIDNGAELENKYTRNYRNSIRHNLEDQVSFNQFWAKVEQKLSDKEKIYFSPDGVYNQININTLKASTNTYVVNKHDVVIMGNSNDLEAVKKHEEDKSDKEAFLLGYPEYGTPTVDLLPGTEVEINDISRILKSDGYQVYQHMEHEANEVNVKSMKSPHIVHIATHGYFKKDVSSVDGSMFGVHTENASNNPLLRSGLILAGTGKSLSDTITADIVNHDNGILTAYEAMNLDLDGTKLVVLSACETGLGEIKSGEGVYGLQRAFQVAGADALIMSLWKVSDIATQKLMTNFYSNWIKMGDKHAAFHKAQLQLMQEFKEPYFWGAFVMIGG